MTLKLLLSAPETAETMSISVRKLWSITDPRGDLPAVKIGSRILYSTKAIEAWIAKKEAK